MKNVLMELKDLTVAETAMGKSLSSVRVDSDKASNGG
jgi:hypothetical protein